VAPPCECFFEKNGILQKAPILPQLKTTSKNLSARITLVLDATFVPNFTFFGLLSHEISIGKK